MNTLEQILQWHRDARPVPTDKDRAVQVGCHLEEVGEMLMAMGEPDLLSELATRHKRRESDCLALADREDLLDSLCDQIVTAVGVAHVFGLNIEGALAEVARSNDSKRDPSGAFLRDDNGKIMKGADYSPPDLTPFLKD